MENSEVQVNKDQGLFVIPTGNAVSCIGFDVVDKKIDALCRDLGVNRKTKYKGTKASYKEYCRLVYLARQRFDATGEQSTIDLYSWGTERFTIGKSTGWIPCHIALKRVDSRGGSGVLTDSIKSFRFLD